jgi:hypothetical protein
LSGSSWKSGQNHGGRAIGSPERLYLCPYLCHVSFSCRTSDGTNTSAGLVIGCNAPEINGTRRQQRLKTFRHYVLQLQQIDQEFCYKSSGIVIFKNKIEMFCEGFLLQRIDQEFLLQAQHEQEINIAKEVLH